MMKFLAALFLTFLIALPVYAEGTKKSAYDRVMETGTLKCGYNFYEPGFMKDEETGDFYGLFYDLVEELGRVSQINIEWTALVDWGNMRQDMESGKVDAFCISVWPNALRAKAMLLSDPFLYVNVESYTRADDDRFKNGNIDRINQDDVTVAVIDQDISEEILKYDFPKAQKLSAMQFGSDAELFEQLKYGKADITFSIQAAFLGFDRENPGILKRVAADKPLRTYGTTIAIPTGEHNLKFVLDTAIEQMQNSGAVDRILRKYEKNYPNTFYKVAKPYEMRGE